jgi:glutamate/tyrosine decarboxylase-like PLP-dependent enzyme
MIMLHMEEEVTQQSGLAGYLHNLVSEHPDFEVLCEPIGNFYCFRYVPNGLANDQRDTQQLLDRLNGEIVKSLQREGSALVNTTQVGNRVAIRVSIRSCVTARDDIDTTFEAIARYGRLLTKNTSVCEPTRDMEPQLCLSESHSSATELSVT